MLGLYAVIYLCAKFRRSRAHYRSIVMKTVTEKVRKYIGFKKRHEN